VTLSDSRGRGGTWLGLASAWLHLSASCSPGRVARLALGILTAAKVIGDVHLLFLTADTSMKNGWRGIERGEGSLSRPV